MCVLFIGFSSPYHPCSCHPCWHGRKAFRWPSDDAKWTLMRWRRISLQSPPMSGRAPSTVLRDHHPDMLAARKDSLACGSCNRDKKQPKDKVLGQDTPGTSGTQMSGYPWPRTVEMFFACIWCCACSPLSWPDTHVRCKQEKNFNCKQKARSVGRKAPSICKKSLSNKLNGKQETSNCKYRSCILYVSPVPTFSAYLRSLGRPRRVWESKP